MRFAAPANFLSHCFLKFSTALGDEPRSRWNDAEPRPFLAAGVDLGSSEHVALAAGYGKPHARWGGLIAHGYLSLDFANPLMPGAVIFGDGETVEGRQGDRFRGADVTMPPPRQQSVERVPPAEPDVTPDRHLAREIPCVWQACLRQSHPAQPGSPSLSEDA